MTEQTKQRSEDMLLDKPNAGGSVWPRQNCPVFTPRDGAAEAMPECWYCRCADFHLNQPKALDVGICCWPKIILK